MIIVELTKFLAPFMPFLVKVGEKSSEVVGEKFGEDAWNKAKIMWSKLQPKIETRPMAKGAVETLAQFTTNERAIKLLSEELKELLDENKALEQEIIHLFESSDKHTNTRETNVSSNNHIVQKSTGNNNTMIGTLHGGFTQSR